MIERFLNDQTAAKVLNLLGLHKINGSWKIPTDLIPDLILLLSKEPANHQKSKTLKPPGKPRAASGSKRPRNAVEPLSTVLSEQVKNI